MLVMRFSKTNCFAFKCRVKSHETFSPQAGVVSPADSMGACCVSLFRVRQNLEEDRSYYFWGKWVLQPQSQGILYCSRT